MAAENQRKTGASGRRPNRGSEDRKRTGTTASRKKSNKTLSLPTGRGSGGIVRIVGGRFKRTPLAVGDREGLRPTPDRVRETVFDWLMHFFGGTLEGLRALDMFAGSGAMGLEAVSRGAAAADVVERNRRGADAIRETVKKLKAHEVSVYAEDVFVFLAQTARTYDLVFIDPPFAAELQAKALRAVKARLASGAYVYVESPEEFSEDRLTAEGFHSVRRGKAGAVFYLLAQMTEVA